MFRKLKANEIECRIQTVKDSGVSLLLYKTARVDRAILDEHFGAMNWQNDFKVIDGKMYGGIGVRYVADVEDKDETTWVWKWDCGSESNTEAEKGQASDCFKRAGFKWGIGVELYSAPFIWVSGAGKYDKFYVSRIEYDENGDISELEIKNEKTHETAFKKTIGTWDETPKPSAQKSAKDTNVPSKAETETLDTSTYADSMSGFVEIKDLMRFYRDNKAGIDCSEELTKIFRNKRKELLK